MGNVKIDGGRGLSWRCDPDPDRARPAPRARTQPGERGRRKQTVKFILPLPVPREKRNQQIMSPPNMPAGATRG